MSCVLANIILGPDGATVVDGSSRALSFPEDRKRFLQIRTLADVIIVGGNTARCEPYGITPIPLIVLSKTSDMGTAASNPMATSWNLNLEVALERIIDQYEHILLETGLSLLLPALEAGLVDVLYVTVADSLIRHPSERSISSPQAAVSLQSLTHGYTEYERHHVPGGSFITYHIAPSHD